MTITRIDAALNETLDARIRDAARTTLAQTDQLTGEVRSAELDSTIARIVALLSTYVSVEDLTHAASRAGELPLFGAVCDWAIVSKESLR